MSHKIAVIGGDGIGPEVTAVALDVMAAAGAEFAEGIVIMLADFGKPSENESIIFIALFVPMPNQVWHAIGRWRGEF